MCIVECVWFIGVETLGGGGGEGALAPRPPFYKFKPTKDLFLFPTPMRLMTVTAATDEIYSFLRVLLIDWNKMIILLQGLQYQYTALNNIASLLSE